MTTDEARLLALHEGFMKANTHEDLDFLRSHTADEDLLWFNLNKSNYHGRSHILLLWQALREARPDTSVDAPLDTRDVRVRIEGDVGWITYLLFVKYDFGELAQWDGGARGTEIWQRVEGEWKLQHCHFSAYEPGNMGGT